MVNSLPPGYKAIRPAETCPGRALSRHDSWSQTAFARATQDANLSI
jgi:hypothetical protein